MKLEEALKLKVGDVVYSTHRKEPANRPGGQITPSISKEEFENLPPLEYTVTSMGYRDESHFGIPLNSCCGYACITKETLENFIKHAANSVKKTDKI